MAAKRYGSKLSRGKKRSRSSRYGKLVLSQRVAYAPEIKHYDVISNDTFNKFGASTTGFKLMNCSCVPNSGPDFDQRIGRKIKILSVEVRYLLTCINVGQVPDTGTSVIVDFWQDNQSGGLDPAPASVYESPLFGMVTPSNASNLKRFKRLRRYVVPFEGVGTTNGLSFSEKTSATHIIKGVNKTVHYDTVGTGTVSDIVDYNWFMMCSPTVPSATDIWRITYAVRYWYLDI